MACGVSLSNAAERIRRPTGRWEPRLLCGSYTGCLQAESVLAWLAACWWAYGQCVYACHRALESSGDRRLRADHGTDRQTLPLIGCSSEKTLKIAIFLQKEKPLRNNYGRVHILYNAQQGEGGLAVCYVRYMEGGGSQC